MENTSERKLNMSSVSSSFKFLSQLVGGLAVLASLVFVGYELKQNNDLAVVQSQNELLALNVEMKTWLTDPDTLSVLMAEDVSKLSKKEQLVFNSLVGAWFDMYELVYLSRDRGILTEEQFTAWRNGMCTLPVHWLEAFNTTINQGGNYLEGVEKGVQRCLIAGREPAVVKDRRTSKNASQLPPNKSLQQTAFGGNLVGAHPSEKS